MLKHFFLSLVFALFTIIFLHLINECDKRKLKDNTCSFFQTAKEQASVTPASTTPPPTTNPTQGGTVRAWALEVGSKTAPRNNNNLRHSSGPEQKPWPL